MENKIKYKYKSNDFDQKGLEAKLEKDNILLRDQINKLQDTIKNLKYDIPQTEETVNDDSSRCNEKGNIYISNIPCLTKESKKNSPYKNKKPPSKNYNSNNSNTNKMLNNDLEENDLMFSFNINSQNRGHTNINQSNGNTKNKEDHSSSIKQKNGAFNTVDYSMDYFDDKMKTKNTELEKEVTGKIIRSKIDKNSKTLKIRAKSKESLFKPLNRHASQKNLTKPNDAVETLRKHNKNNSVCNKEVICTIEKSKEKMQVNSRHYSSLNKKIDDKIQCKTQENAGYLEDLNNGKTQRNVVNNNIDKGNVQKIKLKLPSKGINFKLSENSGKKMTTNEIDNSSNNLALIDSLKKEIKRLNLENETLKNELKEEKKANMKFKDFAYDLLKYYEKPGKTEKTNTNKKKKNSNIYEPAENDFNDM